MSISLIKSLSLPTDERGFTLDARGHPAHFSNNPSLFGTNVKFPLSEKHIQEIYKCSTDIFYFIENYVQIFTLDNGWVVPKLRSYQKKLIQHYLDNRFSNVMMGRQSAKSTTTLLFILWKIIFFPDTTVGMAANKESMATENLSRLKDYFENLPIWLKVGVKAWNSTFITLDNGSKVYSAATSGNTFRGLGLSLLFVDEVAFIDCWDDFSKSVLPTISSGTKSQAIYTTTPKGLNHFYHMWTNGENGKSLFKNFRVEWWEVPGRDEAWKQEMLATLPGGEIEFAQEYACEFLGSSDTLINISSLKMLRYSEVYVRDIFTFGFKRYEEVRECHQYIMTVDPAKDGLDKFAVHVFDVSKFPFIQVASANLNVNYLKMPGVLYEIGTYYNNAFIIIENNEGAGQSVVDKLYDNYEYENLYRDPNKEYYGFRTTSTTRNQILSNLKIFLENNKIYLNDKDTIDQLFVFINRGGKYQADKGYHDDLVMALAILFAPFLHKNMYSDYQSFIASLEGEKEEIENLNISTFGFFDAGTEEVREVRGLVDILDDDYEEYSRFELKEETIEINLYGLR